ncbi:TIGR01777 family oxidoreductase [Gramella sp. AN32]|uniref:TIGR01777 family oxidoreductase n=1 Tax=Christiangramia antarctica TaxID=2058158 RepID=A0ABW5X578_9FLAO|nr:TIGR01777 family oxidoreductase [Gramella sp. AN32]MCM4158063.1 TIGR01777 family protein [Gramella sp. AN32]
MRILITGATGLIGSELSKLCLKEDIQVNYLTTSKEKIKNKKNYTGYFWNPKSGDFDMKCLEGVTTIVHLAGSSIAEPWSRENKKKIIESRTETAAFLQEKLEKTTHTVQNFVSASAIGVYPSSYNKLYHEDDEEVADDFLGEVVEKWEAAADNFEKEGLDVAKIRVGLVLAKDGGMLSQVKKPVKLNLGAPLGNGKQWQSWIHISDLACIFLFAIKKELSGVYNAVSPNPVTNRELTMEIAKQLNKSIWLPNVPGFVLKVILGEMATIVLSSQLVSSKKIASAGYNFEYVNMPNALSNLLK